MSAAPQNSDPGFDESGVCPVAWPDDAEPPEMELLGELEAAGAKFNDWRMAIAIVSAWKEKHCEGPRNPQLAFSRRGAVAHILKPLTSSPTLKQAGQKAHVLEHALNLSGAVTARELAAKLKLSEGRISQIKAELLKSVFAAKPLETLGQKTPADPKN